MANNRYTVAAHIPRGSGDAEWRVMRGKHIAATVDPAMAACDPEHDARRIAACLNACDRLMTETLSKTSLRGVIEVLSDSAGDGLSAAATDTVAMLLGTPAAAAKAILAASSKRATEGEDQGHERAAIVSDLHALAGFFEPDAAATTTRAATLIETLSNELENVTASLENVMLYYGRRMSPVDQRGRRQAIDRAKEVLARLNNRGTEQGCTLPAVAIVLEGGMVASIVSDDPAALSNAVHSIVVIDYDTDGTEPAELTPIPQSDGSYANAIVHEPGIEQAKIELADLHCKSLADEGEGAR